MMIEAYFSAIVFDPCPTCPPGLKHPLTLQGRIGVIADSHGNIASMTDCIQRLTDRRADTIIHLGDIFDSEIHHNLMNIVDVITDNNILAVKGNNDYQIEKSLENGHPMDLDPSDRQRIRQFLHSLALYFTSGNVCFAHSRPFDSIRAFYEPIDTGSTEQAARIFRHTDHHLLFCGHSHLPMLFRWRAGIVTREPIPEQTPLVFQKNEKYIIIVGSADKGECGFIDREKMVYERIRL
jgi:predicted phosphodiesterase